MRRLIIGVMMISILDVTSCGTSNVTRSMTKKIVPVDSFENTEYNLETDYKYLF